MLPSQALQLIAARHVDEYDSAQTRDAFTRLLGQFGAYLENARGCRNIRDVDGDDVRAWVDAPFAGGRPPSLATRHNRRSAARFAFRVLRSAAIVDHDPTIDVELPTRNSRRVTRPLADDEIDACRAASLRTLTETRLPTVLALAEATATTHEIPRVSGADIDLDSAVVHLGGSRTTDPRDAQLTEWGINALARRLACRELDQRVAYDGSGKPAAMQASCSGALGKILTSAGLRGDPTVKPASVRAWAGHRAWKTAGRIEDAARVLGCRSLDTAAAIVGLDWRYEP